jgi:hypothetical protein
MAARRTSRRPPPPDAAARVRHLLALDAANVMVRLRTRQDEMVSLFSRLRDRGPLVETVRCWFTTISFGELSMLSPAEQLAANGFYELLGEVRWYLQYTEDMPGQVQLRLGAHVRKLEERHAGLVAALGPPDASGAPVVNAEIISPRGRKG